MDYNGQSVFDLDGHYRSLSEPGRLLSHHQVRAGAWHARMATAGLPVTGIEDQLWGMREFALTDPSGNRVRIGRGASDSSMSD